MCSLSTHLKVAGAAVDVTGCRVKIGGAQKVVEEIYVKVGGAQKLVFSNLVASVDNANPSSNGSGFATSGDPGTTPAVTVTAAGGVAPYSYAWARVGAAAQYGPYEAVTPTSNVTTFKDQDDNVTELATNPDETWRCTVTDDNGSTAIADVTVTLTWTNLG